MPKKKLSKEENEYRIQAISKLANLLGYPPKAKMPTYIFKALKELEGFGYQAVDQTIVDKTEDIEWALTHKDFASEHGRISYILAIIQNHCKETYDRLIKEKLKEDKEDLPVEIEEVRQIDQKVKDISRFLDDGD